MGRPLIVEGELRRADVSRRTDWGAPLPLETSLDPRTREGLAKAWLEDALLEHASVAAFARFALDLLALGAPADLLRDAAAAAFDEVAHAKLCFSLAARYALKPVGPGALDVGRSVGSVTLAELAVSTFHEGCVGETLGALLAGEQLRRARDSFVRAALEKIAEDEARHAELAWRTVKWALQEGGAPIRAALASAVSTLLDTNETNDAWSEAPSDASVDQDAWHAHGRLSGTERNALRRSGLDQVVEPCARALLGASGTAVLGASSAAVVATRSGFDSPQRPVAHAERG